MPHKTATDMDIGKRIRIARLEIGKSQQFLAKELGITFQQVQKYENGKNRCSPGRLAVISRITGKPVSWFFGEAKTATPETNLVEEFLVSPGAVELATAYMALTTPTDRQLLRDLARRLAAR
jgi:transcriptional regulator with XRE-family HTH domain